MLGKRLINASPASAGGVGRDPAGLSVSSYNTISGGTYRFVDMYMDKVNGDKVYYIRNGGFDMNRIALATMSTPFDLSTLSLSGTSTNWSVGNYNSRIHGSRDGLKLITTGYQNSNNNRNIINYSISSPWSVPTGFTTTQRLNAPGGTTQLAFNDDGTKLYFGEYNKILKQHSLAVPFDTSSQTYEKQVVFNDISSDLIKEAVPGQAGWRIINIDWFVGGLTLYVFMDYYDGSDITNYKIKAYDASIPFEVDTLSDRGNSTDFAVTQFTTGGGSGFSVSDFGHFLIGEQDANNGNQEWWMLS